MIYTLQKVLDDNHLGERWGCFYCGPINMCEHTRGVTATRAERMMILGEAVSTNAISHSNYKHDLYIRPKKTPPAGWDTKANPEWHYLVEEYKAFFRIVCTAMDVNVDPRRFKLAVMRTQYGGIHYCVLADGDLLINPDESLHGTIEKLLEVPV